MAQLVLIAQNRPRRIEAQTLLAQWTKRIEVIEDQPFLDEAIALAKQGKLSAAIEKASQIKSGRTLYAKAQDNLYQWVSELQVAQDPTDSGSSFGIGISRKSRSGDDTASQIGYGRALYSEAAGAIGRWSAELRANICTAAGTRSRVRASSCTGVRASSATGRIRASSCTGVRASSATGGVRASSRALLSACETRGPGSRAGTLLSAR